LSQVSIGPPDKPKGDGQDVDAMVPLAGEGSR
jgi:hypothetical protein